LEETLFFGNVLVFTEKVMSLLQKNLRLLAIVVSAKLQGQVKLLLFHVHLETKHFVSIVLPFKKRKLFDLESTCQIWRDSSVIV
jgi:hypothetical protein